MRVAAHHQVSVAIEMLIIYNKMFVSEGVCMSVPVLCAHVCQREREYECEYERECDKDDEI